MVGVGRGAPFGWAGQWALSVSLVSIALLPLLTILLLRGLDPRALHLARLGRLTGIIGETVKGDALQRVALSELEKLCTESGWELLPLFGIAGKEEWIEVGAVKDGAVRDIRAKPLAAASVTPSSKRPALVVQLRDRVVKGTTVIVLPPDSPPNVIAKCSKIVRVRGGSKAHDRLADAVKLLHQQSRQAIRDANPVWIEEIGEAYRKLLTALPRAWSELGVETYDQGVDRSPELLASSPVDLVARQLFLEVQAAMRSADLELIQEVVSGIYGTLLEASALKAEAVSRAMMSLLVHAYRLAVVSQDPEVRESSSNHSCTYLLEFMQLETYRLRPESPPSERTDSDETHAALTCDALADLLRAAIDNGRVQDVQDVHDAWRRDFELWIGSNHSATSTEPLERIAAREFRLRLALSYWALRTGRRGMPTPASATIEHFAATFGSPREVLEVAADSIRETFESDAWLNWTEAPRFGGTYSPGGDLDLLEAALVICLLLMRQGAQMSIPPGDWISARVESAERILLSLQEPRWNWLFPDPASLAVDVEALRTGLREAAALQRQAQVDHLISTPLSADLQSRHHGHTCSVGGELCCAKAIRENWAARICRRGTRLSSALLACLDVSDAPGGGRDGRVP